MFATNVGAIDRFLRVILGAGLLIWFFADHATGPWHFAKLIGIMPLLTAAMGTCPAYSLFGVSTCPRKV